MSHTASVTVTDPRFPAGSTVGLYDRHGPVLNEGAPTVKTLGVKVAGEIVFENLPDGGRYFVGGHDEAGAFRAVAVTAKVAPAAKERLTGAQSRARLSQTIHQADDKTQVAGARNAKNARSVGRGGQPFSAANAGIPTPAKDRPLEAHPGRRIEDAGSREKLRSATITGEAYPTSADEPQPAMRQEDVPEGVQQRSATPHGTAAIIPDGEVSPAQRQEDAAKGLRQRSDTPSGQVEALPADAQPKPKRGGKTRRANRARTQAKRARKAPAKANAGKRRRSGRTKAA